MLKRLRELNLAKALAWSLLAIAVLAVINYRYLDNLYKLRTMTPVSIPLLISDPKRYHGQVVVVSGTVDANGWLLRVDGKNRILITIREAPSLDATTHVLVKGRPNLMEGDVIRVVGRYHYILSGQYHVIDARSGIVKLVEPVESR